MARWEALDAVRGRRVVVQRGDGAATGVALGVADDGALRVQEEGGGELRVHSGEVSVRAAGMD